MHRLLAAIVDGDRPKMKQLLNADAAALPSFTPLETLGRLAPGAGKPTFAPGDTKGRA
jgi:hypothetical protein